MKTTVFLIALSFIGIVSVTASSKESANEVDAKKEYPKSFASYGDFSNLVSEVEKHRADRLIGLKEFLKMSEEENTIILDTRSAFRYGRKHLEATQEQMTWFQILEQEGTGIWWAICSKDDGTFLGAGGLNDLSTEHKKAEVGFWLLPPFWGKGYMSETMPLILEYAFNKRGLRRIEGFVETKNTNCKKALAKLDFQLEGTMKDCEIKNGAFISLDIYAKFKPL